MNRASRAFLFISAFVFISDAVFVWINYRSAQRALNASLKDELQESRAAFRLALDSTMENLAQTAAFVAGDPRVQHLFLEGKRAVEKEGGGGGEAAAAARDALYRLVSPGWSRMTRDFGTRQLHFHLGPGSVSFLRVHKPSRFGDRMDQVRYTIVDANASQMPTRGFETGRVYSGIRGVVPVFAEDEQGNQVHVGALEAGSSFENMLATLEKRSDSRFAVFLTPEHLKANVWPDFLEKMYRDSPPVGGLFLESSLAPELAKTLAKTVDPLALAVNVGVTLFRQPDGVMSVGAFPLRDYRGGKIPRLADAGLVLLWRDATHEYAEFQGSVRTNIIYAVAAFLLLEVVLYYGVGYVTRRLEQEIQRRTHEVAEANQQLSERNLELDRSVALLKETHQQLVESEKLASLGGLVAGVAHEINTPVGSGVTAASFLKDNVTEFRDRVSQGGLKKADLERFLESARQASEILMANLTRAADLVRSFKQMAVDQSSEQSRDFLLAQYVDEVLTTLQPRLKRLPHRIVNAIPEGLKMQSMPGAFSQIITNLVMNAVTHAFTPERSGQLIISAALLEGDRVRLVFEDDGKGIPAEIQSRIFEPFFTTNREHGGSGLGLNIVYNLVSRRLNGSISVQSTPGEGTRFVIDVPREIRGGEPERHVV